MALVGVELETLVSEPDALTTRPPPSSSLDQIWGMSVALNPKMRLFLSDWL